MKKNYYYKTPIKTIAILIFVFLFTNGCISAMIRAQVKKLKVGGRIFLHKNPKVGDFAIFDSFSESNLQIDVGGNPLAKSIAGSLVPTKIITKGTAKYEITKILDQSIIIRLINEFQSSAQSGTIRQVVDYEVDKTGLQLRTTIIEGPYISEPITVESVKPGETGFIEIYSDKKDPTFKIVTPAGSFKASPVYAIQNIDVSVSNVAGKGTGNTGTNSIIFLNPNVKFQMVYNQGFVSSDFSSELSGEMKIFLKVLNSVPDFFLNPAAGTKSILEIGLKEYVGKNIVKNTVKSKLDEIFGDIEKMNTKGNLTANAYFILREEGNNQK